MARVKRNRERPPAPAVPDDYWTEDRLREAAQAWLDEHLPGDHGGMPPEQYDLQPTSTKYRGPR